MHFEKAYCLYRLNNHSEALKIIDELDDVGYHMKELKAQILYRIENYADCAKVYRDIIKNTNDEYEDERQTNLTAALAFLDKSETVRSLKCVLLIVQFKFFRTRKFLIYARTLTNCVTTRHAC